MKVFDRRRNHFQLFCGEGAVAGLVQVKLFKRALAVASDKVWQNKWRNVDWLLHLLFLWLRDFSVPKGLIAISFADLHFLNPRY